MFTGEIGYLIYIFVAILTMLLWFIDSTRLQSTWYNALITIIFTNQMLQTMI